MGEYCNGIVLRTNTRPDSGAVSGSTIVLTQGSTVIRTRASYEECTEQLYRSKKATIALSIRNRVLLALGLPYVDWLEQTPPKRFRDALSAFHAVDAVVFVVDDSFSYGAFASWEGDTLKRRYASDEFGGNDFGQPFEWEVEDTHPGDLALMATKMLCGTDVISYAMKQDDFTLLRTRRVNSNSGNSGGNSGDTNRY